MPPTYAGGSQQSDVVVTGMKLKYSGEEAAKFEHRFIPKLPNTTCPTVGGNAQHQYAVRVSVQSMIDTLPPGQQLPPKIQEAITRYPAIYKHAQDLGCAAAGGIFDPVLAKCTVDVCPLAPNQTLGCNVKLDAELKVDEGEFRSIQVPFCTPTKEIKNKINAEFGQNQEKIAMQAGDRVEKRLIVMQEAEIANIKNEGGGGGGACTVM